MKIIENIPVWGNPVDESAVEQIKNSLTHPKAFKAAIMADHHKGYNSVCVGGVIAYKDAVSPTAVGADIACGNMCVKLDVPHLRVRAEIKKIMDEISSKISFGVGRANNEKVKHEIFDDPLFDRKLSRDLGLKDLAKEQLGTVGSGNHYVDIFVDENNEIWAGCHFGSRGVGYKIANHFIKEVGGLSSDGPDAEPVVWDSSSAEAQEYLQWMELAGKFAYAGREWVCKKVAQILGAEILESVHNHHNYCIPNTEKIPTPFGWKTIDGLNVGDIVYAFDKDSGLYETKIKNKINTGEKSIYEIKTKNRKIRCSSEHPILVINLNKKSTIKGHGKTNGNFLWKKAKDIKKRDIILCAENYYIKNKKNNFGLIQARLMGAFIGDGWIRNKESAKISGYSLGLAIGSENQIVTKKYLEIIEKVFPEARWKNNAKGAFGISASCKSVYDKLVEWNIDKTSNHRRIPNIVFSMSYEEKLNLLSGYIDADGCICKKDEKGNHGRASICSTSHLLIEDLREIFISIGMCPTNIIKKKVKTNYKEHIVFNFTLNANDSSMLILFHENKKENQRKIKFKKTKLQKNKFSNLNIPEDFFGQYVTSTTFFEEKEEVFDIEVESENHNFICEGIVVHNCWNELVDGEQCNVIRKGCTPAFPGQRGFVGGSMGDISVILEGVDSTENKLGLNSTVHGAGRVMGRMQAKGKHKKIKDLSGNWTGEWETVREGLVNKEDMKKWLKEKNVELRGADVDESPHCYKRLPDVLKEHENSIKIIHTLTPLGVAMAGSDEKDPYKD